MTFADFNRPDDIAQDLALFEEMLAGTCDVYPIEKRYMRNDAPVSWVGLTASAARRPTAALLFAAALVEDVTERKRLQDKALHQAPTTSSPAR